MTITALLGKIANLILNPLITLGFVVATIVFFYGIINLIRNADGKDLQTARRNVLFGIVGLVVMFSVYGILNLVLDTFDIKDRPATVQGPK